MTRLPDGFTVSVPPMSIKCVRVPSAAAPGISERAESGRELMARDHGPAELRILLAPSSYEDTPVAGWVQALAFDAKRKEVYSVDSWGQLRAGSYEGDKPKARWMVSAAHDGWIQDVAVSPDGQQLATCGNDLRVRVWSTAEGMYVCYFRVFRDGRRWIARTTSQDFVHWTDPVDLELDGKRIDDVTTHPAFREMIKWLADVYDKQNDEYRDEKEYQ